MCESGRLLPSCQPEEVGSELYLCRNLELLVTGAMHDLPGCLLGKVWSLD